MAAVSDGFGARFERGAPPRRRRRWGAFLTVLTGLFLFVISGVPASALSLAGDAAPAAGGAEGAPASGPVRLLAASKITSFTDPGSLVTAGAPPRIASYVVDYAAAADGTLTTTETITYSFADNKPHGIRVYYPVRIDYQSSTTQYRFYPMEDIEVSSPSGAPDMVEISNSDRNKVLQIGDEKKTVSGTQTYVITYTVRGVANGFDSYQELDLNAVGVNWPVPVDDVKVTLTAPKAATSVLCFRGAYGIKDTCSGTAGETATFTTTGLSAKQGMTIAAKYPLGTFTDTAPILVNGDPSDGGGIGENISPGLATALSTGTLAFAGGIPAVGGLLMVLAFRRWGRDQQYAGLTPGLSPGSSFGSSGGAGSEGGSGGGAAARIGTGRRGPIAVRFNPPDDTTPGLIGTVIDEEANTIDVSATVIDLAARGYLTIEETKTGVTDRTDWLLTPTRAHDDVAELREYERIVFSGLFTDDQPVLLSDLKHRFAGTLGRAQSAMYAEVVRLGWFRRSPEATRNLWRFGGLAVAALGVLIGILLTGPTNSIDAAAGREGIPSGMLLAIGILALGLFMVVLAKRMPAKTADGSAITIQALGFKEYLATAEASQIRFEEAQSIFSRYLPYAIVFGVAEHWAATFRQVAEAAELAGVPIDMPTWYFFYGTPHFGGFDNIASSMDDFATQAAGTFTSSPAASGESFFGGGSGGGFGGGGFAGGGGFGGGGGGEW